MDRTKRITRAHDAINVALISGLTSLTLACYVTRDVEADSVYQRSNNEPSAPVHFYLTVGAGLYTLYDLIFILVGNVAERTRRHNQKGGQCF